MIYTWKLENGVVYGAVMLEKTYCWEGWNAKDSLIIVFKAAIKCFNLPVEMKAPLLQQTGMCELETMLFPLSGGKNRLGFVALLSCVLILTAILMHCTLSKDCWLSTTGQFSCCLIAK